MLKKYRLLATLMFTIMIPLVIGEYTPYFIKSGFYTISLILKEILIFVLPVLIFSFLMHSLISLQEKAVLFIVLLLVMVAVSNFTAIFTGYTIASSILPFMELNLHETLQAQDVLRPITDFTLPKVISNDVAIALGIVLGIYFAIRPNKRVERIAAKLKNISLYFLKDCFIPILPLFILGFLFKLEQEDVLYRIFQTYGVVLTVIVGSQVGYILVLYFIASGFNLKRMFGYLRNMIPAMITAFSTLSSAATMPVTIACTERNLPNPRFAHMIVPATANIHTLGSALGITLTATATLLAFGYGVPPLDSFLLFAFYYTMAKFAVAGIPGGVILVVAPLLESYLGFTGEMIGIITAVYLLFDPFGTATNVTCNGAFAILFNKAYKTQENDARVEEATEGNA